MLSEKMKSAVDKVVNSLYDFDHESRSFECANVTHDTINGLMDKHQWEAADYFLDQLDIVRLPNHAVTGTAMFASHRSEFLKSFHSFLDRASQVKPDLKRTLDRFDDRLKDVTASKQAFEQLMNLAGQGSLDMIVQVQFKDPDGVYESIRDAVQKSLKKIEAIDEDEREQLEEARLEKLQTQLEKWITYGEYLTVEFDTEAMTAKVVETGK